jgi:hypothetical protein
LSPDHDIVSRLRTLPQPQIRLNYTGTFGQASSDPALFASGPVAAPPFPLPAEGRGPVATQEAGEEPELLVTGRIVQGQLQLVMFSGMVVGDLSTLEQLMRRYLDALRAIAASCAHAELAGPRA